MFDHQADFSRFERAFVDLRSDPHPQFWQVRRPMLADSVPAFPEVPLIHAVSI